MSELSGGVDKVMTDWHAYRELFPVTKNQVYFMTAGAGPVPLPVLDAINARYTRLAQDGGKIFQENIQLVEECRERIARLINAEPDEIAFVPNVSFAMNAIALSLKEKLPLLVPEEEFPSSTIPWINANYKLEFVASTGDLQNNMMSLLAKNRFQLVSSLVQYSTGYKLDLETLCQAIAEHDSVSIINATQCISVLPLDVKKSKIDILIGACHKWMFCGEGITFLYIKKDFFEKMKPGIVGWRSSPFSMQMSPKEDRFYQSARVFEIGWPNMTIFSGLKASLDMISTLGVENIAARITELMNYLIRGLVNMRIPIISNIDPDKIFNILLLGPFDDLDGVINKLADKNIFVTRRGVGIRIAIHFYNNKEDIEKFLSEISKIYCT